MVFVFYQFNHSPLNFNPQGKKIISETIYESHYKYLENRLEDNFEEKKIVINDFLETNNKLSKEKIQLSLNNIWKYTGELFEMDELDNKMLKNQIGVNNKELKKQWDIIVNETLEKAKLIRPEDGFMMTGSKNGIHTELLGKILSEMQYIPRAYPDAKW